MRQAIMNCVWVKLLDYDLEVYQDSGVYINVYVERGQLFTEPPSANVKLRAPGGVYPEGWQAPIAGWYQLGAGQSRMVSAQSTVDAVDIQEGLG